MPRESTPLVRKSGFLEAEKFYVLAYEGDVTEKKYFEDLRQSPMFNNSGSIETIPLKKERNAGNSPLDVKKLLSKAKAEYNFRATDEFWLIIDRDDWEKIHHVDFDALYDDCEKEKNFFIALSNPCFEFLLILHLRKLEDIADGDREKILENEKVSVKHNYIDLYLADCIGDGRGYTKRPKASVFMPRVKVAIENARMIRDLGERIPGGLSTDVYKLVEKLIK